ncbi:MAG: hypothetical protein KAX13_07710, partial [Candidatus Krumholzibacteria bacterium]|nr:hypothetical protein [Candidatus Krumholzibacteria bacterium]
RLYLLPGHYRYRFIVDGESVPDPENPGLDEKGNSFFILLETQGGFEITLQAPGQRAEGEDVELSPFGSFHIVGGSYRDAAFLMGGIDGTQGEKVSGSFAIGYEIATEDIEDLNSDMFFIRGSGGYRFSKGELTAFTRSARLGLGDPLGLFNRVAPYAYPVGLFCRGLLYEGRLPLGVDGKVFYAGRLSGPESSPAETPGDSLYGGREMTDSDLIGLKLGSKLWKIRFAYLMRKDRRPYGTSWTMPGAAGELYQGYERIHIDGLTFRLSGKRPITFEAEILSGRSCLVSNERSLPGEECCPEAIESDREWEKGSRLWAGVRYRDESVGVLLALEQTELEGDPELRGGRPPGRRTSIDGAFDLSPRQGYIGLRGRITSYSNGNGGEVFWYARRNFFLDGDDLTVGHLPFISAESLYEVQVILEQQDGTGREENRIIGRAARIEEYHYGEPFQIPLSVSLLLRGDLKGSRDRMGEIRVSKGFEFMDRFGIFLDMRYVSYGIDGWNGTRDFLNTFAAVYGRLNADSWLRVGAGVNPYLYDRWTYAFSGLGREHFLLDRDVMDAFSGGVTGDALRTLQEAEKSLSEEWAITFEAFIGF